MIWSGSFKEAHKDIPNAVSVLRGLIGISIPFFLFHPNAYFHWVAFYLFIFGAITDFVDGYIARSFSWESNLGKIIDPTTDKILVLVPLATFSYLNLFSVWLIVPIFAREIAVTFCRIAWCLDGSVVGAEKIGKLKFFFQVIAVIFSYLYYLSFRHPSLIEYHSLLYTFMMGSIICAIILTTISGISFFVNNTKNLNTPSFAKFSLATGVGLFSFAPGTWGSLVGLGIAALVQFHLAAYLVTFFFLLWLGFWAISRIDLSKNHDPGFVVLDEVLGMMVSVFMLPLTPLSALVGFLLFRGFDICKPFPLRQLEKLPRFWGILLDDLGAGVYTWIVLWFLFRVGTFS